MRQMQTTEVPPHCDSRVLHAPGECEFCDQRPEWQALRQAWGIAFTGHQPLARFPECRVLLPEDRRVGSTRCRLHRGHEGDHGPLQEWELMPCPADAARPPGSPSDHRRWGGNTATSRRGDPSQPVQTTASVMLYGDQGGREPGDWMRMEQPGPNLGWPRWLRRLFGRA